MSENKDFKKELTEELKTKLLAAAKSEGEDLAKEAVKIIFPLIQKLVLETENKIDDMLVALLPIAEKQILDLLDKIDGEEG